MGWEHATAGSYPTLYNHCRRHTLRKSKVFASLNLTGGAASCHFLLASILASLIYITRSSACPNIPFPFFFSSLKTFHCPSCGCRGRESSSSDDWVKGALAGMSWISPLQIQRWLCRSLLSCHCCISSYYLSTSCRHMHVVCISFLAFALSSRVPYPLLTRRHPCPHAHTYPHPFTIYQQRTYVNKCGSLYSVTYPFLIICDKHHRIHKYCLCNHVPISANDLRLLRPTEHIFAYILTPYTDKHLT
jgi:hypothetical protein